ncbi:MAG: N-acetylmuramoyl-L-alanine amidase [bacterium]|nr:N-acetylmuramoyl-L-alanine amidase [bacterium]MDY4099894.1 N-acetylmuramoyl-L-alanine amidase [Lachnospiraceae bacterium]
MEEKIVRAVSLFLVMFSVFICSSLFYLPALEVKAKQYVAKQMQLRRDREEREEMWATLSGLEFLDYSTRQAYAAAEGELGEEQVAQTLDFPQQLRLELPKNCTKEDVTIHDHYVTRTIEFQIKGAGDDYPVRYPMLGKSDHISELNYYAGNDGGTLELVMEHVYELSLDWQGQYLYIDFIAPQDIYDKLVVIDAGHGADMPGAIVSGVQEKDIDLAIVKQIKKLFDQNEDQTIGVYYTRLDDSDPAFADRAGLPNDIGADLFVSIHNNSYPAAASVNGTAVLYDEKKETEGNSSKHLADILLKKTTEALGTKNMGLVAGNDIYVIRSCEAPAALVEVGFMTNPKELANLTDKNYQKKCARAIYEGILQALEEGY